MTRFYLAFMVLIFMSPHAHALFEGGKLYTSLAYMNENLTRTTRDASGKRSFLGTAKDFPFFVGMTMPSATAGASWAPRIGYTFLPREDADGAVKIEYLIVGLPFIQTFGGGGAFDFMAGTSYVRQTLKGQGGTISSTNGGSSATFYAGDYDQVAEYMTVDFGLGYSVPPYRTSAEIFILSALSDKRSYNLLINFTYFWGN